MVVSTTAHTVYWIQKAMKVSLEHLYHYLCDRCEKWWTCANIKPAIGKEVYCPHCGNVNIVEAIASHEVE